MPTIKKFEDLEIWQLARILSKRIFLISLEPPFIKDYRFRDQLRAAAGSVMDNIAEGFERSGRLEFINFLSIAKGSIGEVKSQLYRATDQSYLATDLFNELYAEYDKLAANIAGFITYLNKSVHKGQKFRDRT